MFIIFGVFIFHTFTHIRNKNKLLGILFIIAILFVFGYSQINYTNNLIESRLTSYGGLKDAGLWIKENSNTEDMIIGISAYQLQYYSRRSSVYVGGSTSLKDNKEFEEKLSQNPDIKYYVVSVYEKTPEWMFTYPDEHRWKIVQAYFADAEQQQPILIIYEIG